MNRFNQLLDRGEYVPLVQPLPYDAMMKFGELAKQESDQNLAAASELQTLSKNIKRDPEDEKFYRAFEAKYTPQISNLVNLALEGSPEFKKEYYRVKSEFINDPAIPIFAYNYEVGKDARKQAADMNKSFNWSPTGRSDTFTPQARSRTELTPIEWAGHDPWKSYFDDAAKVIGGIADTQISYDYDRLARDPNLQLLVRQSIKGETGIKPDRMTTIALGLVDEFAQTEGGISLIKDMQYKGSTRPEIVEALFNALVSIGNKQVHVKGGGSGWALLSQYAQDAKTPEDRYSPSTGTVTTYGDVAPIRKTTNDLKKNSTSRDFGDFFRFPTSTSNKSRATTQTFKDRRLLEKVGRVMPGAWVTPGNKAPTEKALAEATNQYIDAFNNMEFSPNYLDMTDSKEIRDFNYKLFTAKQITTAGKVRDAKTGSVKSQDGSFLITAKKDGREPTVSQKLPLINPWGTPYAYVARTKDNNEYIVEDPLATAKLTDYETALFNVGKAVYSPALVEITLSHVENNKTVMATRYADFEYAHSGRYAESGLPELVPGEGTMRIYDKDGKILVKSDRLPYLEAVKQATDRYYGQ